MAVTPNLTSRGNIVASIADIAGVNVPVPLQSDATGSVYVNVVNQSGGGGGGGGGSVTQGTVPWVVTTTGSINVTVTNPTTTETGGINVYTSGPQAVSGTVSAIITNQPATVGVTGSINTYTSGLQGVSGTVSAIITNQPAVTGVSGSVALTNWPATIGVSSSAGGVSVTGSVALTAPATTNTFQSTATYLSFAQVTASTGPTVGASFCPTSIGASLVAQFNGGATANQLTGSLQLQGSNDNSIFATLASMPIAVGPGNVSMTLAVQSPVYTDYIKGYISWTAGTGISVTGSLVLKG